MMLNRGCPWITDNHELRQAMLERDEAYQAWLDLHTPESREDYCRLRNSVKAQLAQARREFLGRQLLASDRKEFWSSLRRFYLAPSASAHSTSDKSAAEQRARADRFNEFFASTISVTVAMKTGADSSDESQEDAEPAPPDGDTQHVFKDLSGKMAQRRAMQKVQRRLRSAVRFSTAYFTQYVRYKILKMDWVNDYVADYMYQR
ncbi:hypothetical protein FJT64_025082 [Amphibalanus amphitrite]|uniref:Uncharacterized protein n=1 Tax=Amphibalanus amphitrite TaxID=1232801 RepID=A0A6A4W8S7_AMPAM|nr:hypothetical protein FJT64_025082 [Amphibalanus amphitrite]